MEGIPVSRGCSEGAWVSRWPGTPCGLVLPFPAACSCRWARGTSTTAPSPAWHALPSTVLENILDLCDIYRDKHKKSIGIPTGLFAKIDPEPMLTTLCICMASDDHVRDPSLRGRAVKLLHRLCFSYPSCQDKLNQPPLLKHFVPCLVGVFIAVEKAILSYYDLAYRYKYELRVPVMDLFDLALKHEQHVQVLTEFSRGSGNDRFLKLLTQLINDSNSQIEEAIRTLKEYHEHKKQQEAKAAARSSGGQHDETVLDDDQTEGGEDVYRRSRMNYKEHAKKYFSCIQDLETTLASLQALPGCDCGWPRDSRAVVPLSLGCPVALLGRPRHEEHQGL